MPNPDSFDSSAPLEAYSAGSKISFRELLQLIYDRFWLIVSCVGITLFLAVLYLIVAQRVYEATATIQVEKQEQLFSKGDTSESEEQVEADVNTVGAKFTDYSLLEKVLEENKLLSPNESGVSGPEALAREKFITGFGKRVKVSARRSTRLVDIAVQGTNPRLAAQLANSLVQNYIEQAAQLEQTAQETDNVILREQADQFKRRLEASNQALQDYRKQIGSVSLDQTQDILTPQLHDINRRLTEYQADLIVARGAYEDSLKMPTNIDNLLAYPQITSNLDVAQISTDIAKLNSEFAVIRQRYREKHPKYILAEISMNGLKEQLAITALNVRSRLQESLRIDYQNTLTATQGLETQLHDTEALVMKLSDSSVHFDVLTRQVQSDKALYDAVVTRLGETAVPDQISPQAIRLVQPATVPNLPVSPKKFITLVLGMFGGLVISAGLIFLLKITDTSFQTADEVEHYLGLPMLGLIPKLEKISGKDNEFASIIDLQSAKVEGFHALRANLSMMGLEHAKRTYLFTSSLPGEGKTFASINYAASLAQQGMRTLLIDLDLRRPTLEKILLGKTDNLPGITDYFSGKVAFGQLSRTHQDIPKLFWIPAGNFISNPTEILLHADFQKLLDEALLHFDRVVIDTAPVLPVSDTVLLAGKAQTVVVLVIKACQTPRASVDRSIQLLKNAKAPIGGTLLNYLPNRRFLDYHNYGDARGYGHYGRKDAGGASQDWWRLGFLKGKQAKNGVFETPAEM
jgi:polysaccharide biosynthesis transport protein